MKNIKQKFLEQYEDQWDYSFANLEKGDTLAYFIKEKRPDYSWMFNEPEPKHISEIPVGIRDEYIRYLKNELMEFWDYETVEKLEANYTLDDAIEEFKSGIE